MAPKVRILILAMFAAVRSLESAPTDFIDPESRDAPSPPEDHHIWDVPDPYPLTAVVCAQNDFGCEHADPNLHTEVELPSRVRDALYQVQSIEGSGGPRPTDPGF